MTAVVVDALRFRHPGAGREALDGLSLSVPEGALTAVVGPSGSGKTTLLRVVAGIERPDAGRVLLGGRDVTAVPPERRGAAMMVQRTLLFPHMTVAGNVAFGLRMRGQSAAQADRAAAAMLERVRLGGFGPRRPDGLSGGEAQRVALARALVVGPRVLLLDEPLSSLDPALREDLRAEIRRLQRETGTTTLLVTHDREEALAMADRIALVAAGRLVQEGAPEDLFERPATVEAALTFAGCNVLRGRVADGRFAASFGVLDGAVGGPDGPAAVSIRPEAIRLGPGPNAIGGWVTSAAYRGTHVAVEVRAGNEVLRVVADAVAARGLAAGDAVSLTIPPDRIWRIPEPQRESS